MSNFKIAYHLVSFKNCPSLICILGVKYSLLGIKYSLLSKNPRWQWFMTGRLLQYCYET